MGPCKRPERSFSNEEISLIFSVCTKALTDYNHLDIFEYFLDVCYDGKLFTIGVHGQTLNSRATTMIS